MRAPLFSLLPDVPSEYMPQRGSGLAAGHDLMILHFEHCADVIAGVPLGDACHLPPGEGVRCHTGVRIHLRPEHWAGIYGRSSLRDRGLSTMGTGVIDADYTGELIVIVRNLHPQIYRTLRAGQKIAQLIVHNRADCHLAYDLPPVGEVKPRGPGGFGSTGE